MKIVTIVTAGLVAMLGVAAAATPAAAHPYDQYIRGRSFFGALFGASIARMVVSYPTNEKPGTARQRPGAELCYRRRRCRLRLERPQPGDFLRDTRARARRKQTNSSRNALRSLTLPHKRIATWLGCVSTPANGRRLA